MRKFKPVTINEETSQPEEPAVKIDVENLKTPDDNIEILGSNHEFSLTMYLDPNTDQKYMTRFIKSVERLIRGNEDYKLYLESLRENSDLSADAFFPNITSYDAEIQLHHHPFNLYTICMATCNKMLDEGQKVSSFILADKVLQLHFDNVIGLVPLSVTMHEIAHLNRLKILRKQIYGHWEKFYKEYSDYLSDYDHNIIKDLVERKVLSRDDDSVKELTFNSQLPEIEEDSKEEENAQDS